MNMNKHRWLITGLTASALLATSACVTDPNTGEKKISRTAIGGVGGVVVGGLLGGCVSWKSLWYKSQLLREQSRQSCQANAAAQLNLG